MSPSNSCRFVAGLVCVSEGFYQVFHSLLRVCCSMNFTELALVRKVVAQQYAKVDCALEVEDHMSHGCVGRHCRSGHVLVEMSAECCRTTRSWLRYKSVPIADQNRCLPSSSNFSDSSISPLTSGVVFCLRCCMP